MREARAYQLRRSEHRVIQKKKKNAIEEEDMKWVGCDEKR